MPDHERDTGDDAIGRRLHDELDAVAGSVAPTPTMDEAVPARMRQRARRRAGVIGALGAVALVALIGGALVLTDDDPDQVDTAGPADALAGADANWEVTAPAPIEPRMGFVSAWTGDELLVWGGWGEGAGLPDSETFDDGAAYDPDTDTWRTIAAAPIDGRSDAASVWTGEEWIILGGTHSSAAPEEPQYDIVAYDPDTDTWRMPVDPAFSGLAFSASAFQTSALWTGDEVVLVDVVGPPGGDLVSNSFALDPDTLYATPLGSVPGAMTGAVWTGENVLTAGADSECDERCVYELPLHGADAETVSTTGGPNPPLVWVDGHLVGQDGSFSIDDGADPLPRPNDFNIMEPVVAGSWFIGASAVEGDDDDPSIDAHGEWWQWSPATGEVVDLPAAPFPFANYNGAAVWTGEEVLIWGGHDCPPSPSANCVFRGVTTGLRLTLDDGDGETGSTTSLPTDSPTTVDSDVVTDTTTLPGTGPTTAPPTTDGDSVPIPTIKIEGAGTSFGMCAGLCLMDLAFDDERNVTFTASAHPGIDPEVEDIVSRGQLTDSGHERLRRALLDLEIALDEPEVVVGCPDCADGGAAWVVLVGGDQRSRITYPFGGAPEHLFTLDDITMSLRDAFIHCESSGLVEIDPDACTPTEP